MAASGKVLYSVDEGIHRSPLPPVSFPAEPSLSLITFLFRNIASYPDRLAIADADSGESLTFAQLCSAVRSTSAGLSRLGVRKGTVVLICAPNSIHFAVSFFAIIAAGAVATTVNPLYTVSELSKQAIDSGSKVVISVTSLWDKVKFLRIPTVFIGPKATPSVAADSKVPILYLSDLMSVPEAEYSPPEVHQSDICTLLYSSGTTGTSKGVMLSHRNFICTSLMVTRDQDLRGDTQNIFLCVLPMFHVFGLSVITYAQLQRGNSLVVMGRFEVDSVLRSIEKYRVTHFFVVPPIMITLAKQGRLARYDLSSLKYLGSGAAPMGKDLMKEVAKNYPETMVLQGYGLTESCGFISIEYPEKSVGKYGSVGFLAVGVDGKVLNVDTQEPLPPNQLGELCFRGPNVMQGYFNNPQATELTLDKDGWLHTGDLGYFDENGLIFVFDRIKELIKYKGLQVAPAELEGLLLSHPDIVDAVVIPFPDDEAGEIPIGYVVRSPNSSITEDEVLKFIANQVAPYKKLRRVTFVNSVPKSASGKILRRELIQKVKSKL